VLGFEATQALKDAGVDFAPVPPRYRTTYFSHSFSLGYSAGYYAYLWSEKLDADTVEWFKENGGLLRKNGDHFRQTCCRAAVRPMRWTCSATSAAAMRRSSRCWNAAA
jgi:peptidyl-dipeptidase Dcp